MTTDRKRRRGRSLIAATAVAGALAAVTPACGSVGSHIYVVNCEVEDPAGNCPCGGYLPSSQGNCVIATATPDGGRETGGGDGG